MKKVVLVRVLNSFEVYLVGQLLFQCLLQRYRQRVLRVIYFVEVYCLLQRSLNEKVGVVQYILVFIIGEIIRKLEYREWSLVVFLNVEDSLIFSKFLCGDLLRIRIVGDILNLDKVFNFVVLML